MSSHDRQVEINSFLSRLNDKLSCKELFQIISSISFDPKTESDICSAVIDVIRTSFFTMEPHESNSFAVRNFGLSLLPSGIFLMILRNIDTPNLFALCSVNQKFRDTIQEHKNRVFSQTLVEIGWVPHLREKLVACEDVILVNVCETDSCMVCHEPTLEIVNLCSTIEKSKRLDVTVWDPPANSTVLPVHLANIVLRADYLLHPWINDRDQSFFELPFFNDKEFDATEVRTSDYSSLNLITKRRFPNLEKFIIEVPPGDISRLEENTLHSSLRNQLTAVGVRVRVADGLWEEGAIRCLIHLWVQATSAKELCVDFESVCGLDSECKLSEFKDDVRMKELIEESGKEKLEKIECVLGDLDRLGKEEREETAEELIAFLKELQIADDKTEVVLSNIDA